jgi:hypothetical protein
MVSELDFVIEGIQKRGQPLTEQPMVQRSPFRPVNHIRRVAFVLTKMSAESNAAKSPLSPSQTPNALL